MTSRVNNADETKLRRNENINYSLDALAGDPETMDSAANSAGLRAEPALPGLFDRLHSSAHCTGMKGKDREHGLILALPAPIDETSNCAHNPVHINGIYIWK